MKTLIFATFLTMQIAFTQAQAMIVDSTEVGVINSVCFYGFDNQIDKENAAECFLKLWVTSLPTMLVGDLPMLQNSSEYIALSLDQAQRTINGETTAIFGNDKALAQQFINSINTIAK